MTDITKAIERAKELDKAATPGPWNFDTRWDPTQRHVGHERGLICNTLHGNDDANAKFIAESRSLLPQMIAELERFRELHALIEPELAAVTKQRDDLLKRWIDADAKTKPIEWRRVSVLTQGIIDKHPHWALRLAWTGDVIVRRVVIAGAPAGDGEATHCRPVDREGVPIPWFEVGL